MINVNIKIIWLTVTIAISFIEASFLAERFTLLLLLYYYYYYYY